MKNKFKRSFNLIHYSLILGIYFLSLYLLSTKMSYANSMDNIEWWKDNYDVSKNNELISKITEVIRRLWETTDSKGNSPSLLVLTEKADLWLESWAFVLPDNTIVISESLFREGYENSRDLTIQEIAFVLAHEIIHIINKDNKTGIGLFAGKPHRQFVNQTTINKLDDVETLTDKKALLLAAMAGYKPRKAFDGGDQDFLKEYVRRVRTNWKQYAEADIPEWMGNRSDQLVLFIREFAKKLKLFEQGLEKYQMGDYKNAINSWKEFLDIFPSREVYGNIGAAYHNIARSEIILCGVHGSFPFPRVEYKTRANGIFLENKLVNICNQDEIRENISSAEQNYKKALANDQYYALASYNLMLLDKMIKKLRQ